MYHFRCFLRKMPVLFTKTSYVKPKNNCEILFFCPHNGMPPFYSCLPILFQKKQLFADKYNF